MAEKVWQDVDGYYEDLFGLSDPVMEKVLAMSDAGGLPAIQVSPLQGRLLMMLAQMHGARRILEVGTLGGYSTIWLARALPAGGRVITLEADAKHAKVACKNIARAGLADVVELREGKALDTLPELAAEGLEAFDLIFIDADKSNNPHYFDWALRLSHKGTLIIVDNVVRDGAVIEADSTDPNIQGVRRLFEILAAEPRVVSTALQTVGSKGYDGFVIALVKEGV